VQTLVYADVFNFPLTAAELQRYLIGRKATPETIHAALQKNLTSGAVVQFGDYYTLAGRAANLTARAEKEQVATQLWPQARSYGRLISMLPFVRMVAVTGSLAMDNTGTHGDIDYIIVTTNARLWLCRLFVLAIVRLAAWHGVRLCPNYFITERALVFTERNLYVAHEFAQMIPLFGLEVHQRMQTLNAWVYAYLPNAEGLPPRARQFIQTDSAPKVKTMLEALLITRLFDRLERWEMNRKICKLSRQSPGNPEALFTSDVCKGHFDRHRRRTETNLAERLMPGMKS